MAAHNYREGMSRDERAPIDEDPALPDNVDDPTSATWEQGPGPRELDEGPSALWALLLAVAAAVLALAEVAGVVQSLPERGWQQSMIPLVLSASLLAGAYSLARVLQLAAYALTRPALPRRREPSFALSEAHSLHAIWLIGLGASIAFMGALGVWSSVDGRTSGLEPGWPLILIGAELAALTGVVSRSTTRAWRKSAGRR